MNVNMRILAVNDLTTIKDSKETPAVFGDVFPSSGTTSSTAGVSGTRRSATARRTTRIRNSAGTSSAASSRSSGEAPLDYTRAYATSPADEPRTR